MESQFEEIFNAADVDRVWHSNDPTSLIYELIERNNRRKRIFDSDRNVTRVMTEFFINNLIYLKENFILPNELLSKLLNVVSVLITNIDRNPNYNEIYKNKLQEIRKGIEGFNLKIDEIANILRYINNTYFPYIKLYYDFCNRTRIVENKKIDIIINRPTLIPPLNVAREIKEEVKKKEEEVENQAVAEEVKVRFFNLGRS
jgi:hypothetical protein